MVTFSQRLQIVKAYKRFIHDANAENEFKLNDDPMTFMGFLESAGVLDDANCRRFIAEFNMDESLKHFSARKDCT